ncbi:30s ribosomal protein s4 [mine drainage metagenome]|uniref:30s ribosomal protein s4 n=1 Tax=mine drainage metagenome TaxID=410659 RepID=T1BS76_9ZZZZ
MALTEGASNQLRVKEAATLADSMDLRPAWVDVDGKKLAGVLKTLPDRADLPSDINESLIVELYSK